MKTGYMIHNYQWHRSTLYFFHESWTKTIQYILTKHHYIINMFKRVSTSTRGKVYWHIWETSSTSHIRSILIGIYFVKVIRKCKLLILFQEIQPLKLLKPDEITYNSLDVFWITHTDEMLWRWNLLDSCMLFWKSAWWKFSKLKRVFPVQI